MSRQLSDETASTDSARADRDKTNLEKARDNERIDRTGIAQESETKRMRISETWTTVRASSSGETASTEDSSGHESHKDDIPIRISSWRDTCETTI